MTYRDFSLAGTIRPRLQPPNHMRVTYLIDAVKKCTLNKFCITKRHFQTQKFSDTKTKQEFILRVIAKLRGQRRSFFQLIPQLVFSRRQRRSRTRMSCNPIHSHSNRTWNGFEPFFFLPQTEGNNKLGLVIGPIRIYSRPIYFNRPDSFQSRLLVW